jgi:hypothetical protein
MIFVMVAEGRLWLVGRDDFGLWWRCSCMVGSMMKGICDSLVGTLDVGGVASMKGGMMKMTAMVVASKMCG